MDVSKKFICNLRLLVDDADSDDIINWNTLGDTVCIHDKIKLTEILPRFFRHNNFNSFNRQLNLYGFRKIKFGKPHNNLIAFKHKYFTKHHPHNLKFVKRQGDMKSFESIGIQTDIPTVVYNNEFVDDNNLRINVLENEIDSLKAEVDELRASYGSMHVKLSNQQNLFYAAFRAMNNPQKQSDVLFNVFIKPNYQSKLKVDSDYKFRSNFQPADSVVSESREMVCETSSSTNMLLKLKGDVSTPTDQSHTQSLQQTYEAISNNYLNNPNFFTNYPIYVKPIKDEDSVDIDQVDVSRNDSVRSVDSNYLMEILSNLAETATGNDLD